MFYFISLCLVCSCFLQELHYTGDISCRSLEKSLQKPDVSYERPPAKILFIFPKFLGVPSQQPCEMSGLSFHHDIDRIPCESGPRWPCGYSLCPGAFNLGETHHHSTTLKQSPDKEEIKVPGNCQRQLPRTEEIHQPRLKFFSTGVCQESFLSTESGIGPKHSECYTKQNKAKQGQPEIQ